MTTLRQKTNLARKLQPQRSTWKQGKAIWGMRSVSDKAKCIQVEIFKSVGNTTISKGEVVRHGQYVAKVHRINGYQGWFDYYGPHLVEYAIASIVGEATQVGKKVVFYSSLKSASLKRKIAGGSLIKVTCGKTQLWAIVGG